MSNSKEGLSVITNELPDAQVADVAGGGDCDATVSIGTGGVQITSPIDGLGSQIIATYEGMIEATSYAIERIANAIK